MAGSDLDLGMIVTRSDVLRLPREARSTHLHVVGSTGSGKSKFLEHLIRQDILANLRSGCGMLVIDPHGSLFENIIAWMAYHDLDRPLIPIDLHRTDWVVGYNLLRTRPQADPAVVVDAISDAVSHVWGAADTDATPRLARWLGNITRVLYEKGYTLVEAIHLIGEDTDLRRAMTANVSDAMTRRDWARADGMSDRDFEAEVSSTVNRLRRFLTNGRLQLMFGQSGASLDFSDVLANGSIVVVSLARRHGNLSKENTDLFATLLLGDLWLAAQQRGKSEGAKPFYVYVDEFQRFLTPTIAESLDEARGFGLHLTLAHQFPNQLRNAGDTGRRVYDSVMENARSKAVFSLTTKENREPMAEWLFAGVLDPDEVKHEMYSTKVMEYREEDRRTSGSSVTRSTGGTRHTSRSVGSDTGRTESYNMDAEQRGEVRGTGESETTSEGTTDSFSESTTETESNSSMLVPIMGKELSSIQYRSLEEQHHRMMATLFEQEQRRCVVRLRGMRAPVGVEVPIVKQPHVAAETVDAYVCRQLERLPFASLTADARHTLDQRDKLLADTLLGASPAHTPAEPVTVKRRLRRGS